MTYFAAVPCPHCGTYHLLGGELCDCRTKLLPPVIIGEGSLDDQIRYAVRCVCGEVRALDGTLFVMPSRMARGTLLLFHRVLLMALVVSIWTALSGIRIAR